MKIIGYKFKEKYKKFYRIYLTIINIESSRIGIASKEQQFSINSPAHNKIKEAGVLDIWFEPVYKEEFKIGDWVVVLETDEFYYNSEKCAQQIIEINYYSSEPYLLNFKYKGSNSYKQIRLATQEEIEEATKPKKIIHSV